MSSGQQSGLKGTAPLAERPLKIERTQYAVLRRSERKIDERSACLRRGPLDQNAAMRATRVRRLGIAPERTTHHDPLGRHECRQCPCCSALGRPFLAGDQDPADPRIDGVEQERRLERILTDESSEWIDHRFSIPKDSRTFPPPRILEDEFSERYPARPGDLLQHGTVLKLDRIADAKIAD
jgi:hypothetical protein